MENQKRIQQLKDEIVTLRAECQRLSVDAVTGLAGRGVLDRALEMGFYRTRRGGPRLAFAMIDLDHFKKVNDTHGHQIGDRVLYFVAQSILTFTRQGDTLARYGGEEFGLLLGDSSELGLAIVCEKIRSGVEVFKMQRLPPVTVSIGYAVQEYADESAADVVARADRGLYKAKRGGRNAVRPG